ncbi:CoA transferase subunit A [Bacillus sp. JJ1764]|uniref:CoA transferase subunit A n=1 Tax=Bacillus sp. JJ1764 TaxID=3122964 RepID=UPI003000C912
MNKVVSLEEALSVVKNGQVIMVGGFAGTGSAEKIIDGLVEKGIKNLTLICNDTGLVDQGVGKMIVNKQFKKVIVSHIGTNPETGRQLQEGELEVELVPQGTLVERIRSGGYGLGGVLTKTGLGTLIEEGKQKVVVDGEEYLLEKPLKADVAIIFADKADKMGNLVYHGSKKSHSPLMASAAETTIVQVNEVVEIGELNPDAIETQCIFVDYVIEGGY